MSHAAQNLDSNFSLDTESDHISNLESSGEKLAETFQSFFRSLVVIEKRLMRFEFQFQFKSC